MSNICKKKLYWDGSGGEEEDWWLQENSYKFSQTLSKSCQKVVTKINQKVAKTL
jgi:hypothetical protein